MRPHFDRRSFLGWSALGAASLAMPHRTPAVTPTDAQRQAFATELEAQYRRDWEYYAGKGPIAYGEETVEALALPKDVLEKFYSKNAARIIGVK